MCLLVLHAMENQAIKLVKVVEKKERTSFSKYEWIWYAQSYLSLARIGLEELTREEYMRRTNNALTKNNTEPGTFIDGFAYRNKHLLFPIIYNLKNAIELIIKSLMVTIDKEFVKKHDMGVVINGLKITIEEKKLILTKPKKVEELIEIANKYYKLEFWNKKLFDSCVFDSQNDIFRYPDNSAKFVLNLEILKSVSEKDIKELQEDIEELNSLLGIIGRGIEVEKSPELYKK